MAQSSRPLNINFSLLKSHPEKAWLLADLQKQIAKDLACERADIPDDDLEEWLEQWLMQYQSKGQSLVELFYRVDLDEKYLSGTSAEMAEALLKREAIKVYFRAQYSGKI